MQLYTNEFTAELKAEIDRSPFSDEELAAMPEEARHYCRTGSLSSTTSRHRHLADRHGWQPDPNGRHGTSRRS
ncbi:hypothetical protein ACP6ZN_005124 [Enterobacter cloacae]